MHLKLGDDRVLVLRRELKRDEVYERLFGDDDAAGVHRGVPGDALQFFGGIY